MVAALGVDQRICSPASSSSAPSSRDWAGALQVPRLALTTVMDTTVIVEAFVVVVIGAWARCGAPCSPRSSSGCSTPTACSFCPRRHRAHVRCDAVVLIVRPWGLLGRPEIQMRAAVSPVGEMGPAPWHPAGSPHSGRCSSFCLSSCRPSVWMAVEIFAFALFAASLHLLMGLGGMVSFGHAAYFGLGAYGAALLLKLGGWPMPLASSPGRSWPPSAPLCSDTSACGSRASTSPCSRLAFAQIVFAVVHQWDDVTGGDNGVLSVWPPAWLKSRCATTTGPRLRGRGGVAASGSRGLALRPRPPGRARPRAAAEAVWHQHSARSSGRPSSWPASSRARGRGGFVFLKGSVFPVYTELMSVQPLVMVLLGGGALHRVR